MRHKPRWAAASSLLSAVLLSACVQTVQLYPGARLPEDQVATLHITHNRMRVTVDGETVNWNRSPMLETPLLLMFGADDVYIKLLPGLREIEWSLSQQGASFSYNGRGSTDMKQGHRYKIHWMYLKGDPSPYTRPGYVTYHVPGCATWLTDTKTGEVLIGKEPSWKDRGLSWPR